MTGRNLPNEKRKVLTIYLVVIELRGARKRAELHVFFLLGVAKASRLVHFLCQVLIRVSSVLDAIGECVLEKRLSETKKSQNPSSFPHVCCVCVGVTPNLTS